MEPQATSVATAESQPDEPSITRLVIRVKIVPAGPPPPTAWWRRKTSALLLIAGAVAILLSWVGISMFKTDPTSEPVPTPTDAAPAITAEPLPQPAETAATKSVEVEPEARAQPDAPPSPVNEVIPDVPLSARETIRGTIRVSIRVTIDKAGNVLATTADEPGPSRYFRRLATEAAKKWTFTPTASEAQRIMLVTFSFTRAGTTARAKQP